MMGDSARERYTGNCSCGRVYDEMFRGTPDGICRDGDGTMYINWKCSCGNYSVAHKSGDPPSG